MFYVPVFTRRCPQKVLPALLHGEAVNVDMSFMVYVAQQRGLLTAEQKQRIIRCMSGLQLPVWHPAVSLELLHEALRRRREHSDGSLRMPLPTGLGCAGTGPEAAFTHSFIHSGGEWTFCDLCLSEIFHEMIEDDVLHRVHRTWTEELCTGNNST